MQSAEQKLIHHLKEVCWSPPQETSKLLTSNGIKHKFCGVGVEHPREVRSAKQVHGKTIVQASDQQPEADGIWTDVRNTIVGVRTADCLPILLASNDASLVMAVHGGWRGMVAGILPEAVRHFRDTEKMFACIGPAISREQFEIGPEVIESIQDTRLGLSSFALGLTISKGRGDRWHFDLALAATLQLIECGLFPANIEVIQACTKSLTQWHSYRREGKGCGSNWSWIEGG